MIRDTKKQAQGCTVANAVHTNKLVLETMINWPKNLNSLQCNILSPKDSASKSNLIISGNSRYPEQLSLKAHRL